LHEEEDSGMMKHEPYLSLILTREEACHVFLTMTEKGSMLRGLAKQSKDAINEMILIDLNDGIVEKMESHITCLGIRAPAGQE
jgi:hypothetical protein